MTLFIQTEGTRKTVAKKVATTDTTLVSAVAQGMRVTLESIRVSCDATTSDFSLWVNDGTTDFYLAQATAVAANDDFMITNHHVLLREGWSMKCKTTVAGNHLHVTVSIVESMANRGANKE